MNGLRTVVLNWNTEYITALLTREGIIRKSPRIQTLVRKNPLDITGSYMILKSRQPVYFDPLEAPNGILEVNVVLKQL